MSKQPNGHLFVFRLVMLNWLACCLICRGLGNVLLRLPYKDLSTDPVTAGDHSRWLCKAGVRYGSREHCPELRLTQASHPVETDVGVFIATIREVRYFFPHFHLL